MTHIHAHSNRIIEAIDFVDSISKRISDYEGNQNAALLFDSSQFWTSIRAACKRIFLDVTKLSLALSAQENISSANFSLLVNSIQDDLEDLSSVFFKFPKQQGLTLRTILRDCLKTIVSYCDEYFKFIQKTPVTSQNFENEIKHLQSVILKSTEDSEKLPVDNKFAAIQILEQEEALINDAFDELREELSNQIEARSVGLMDDVWNNQSFEMAEKGVDVMKTSKALCSKIKSAVKLNGNCSTENQIEQLDDLVDTFRKLSPAVDDFISSLYPPTNFNQVEEYVLLLKNVMNQLLLQTKNSHYITESDMQWVNFLGHAVTHNCNKMNPTSTASESEGPLLILNNLSINNR